MTGRALCIGLNHLDPAHYDGWNGLLANCVNDALAMADLAERQGCDVALLLDEQATNGAVTEAMERLAFNSKRDDYVLVSDSRHGGWVPDVSGDEVSGNDTVLCWFDGPMLDDYWGSLFIPFAAGVRLVYVSDSCHAEGNWRDAMPAFLGGTRRPRRMPADVAERVPLGGIERQQEALLARPGPDLVRASCIALAACREDQLSSDGPPGTNGAYTGALLKALPAATTYRNLQARCRANLPGSQQPPFDKRSKFGAVWPRFYHQRPFTVMAP